MNSFVAKIKSIKNEQSLHVISFDVAGKTTFWMMGLELPNVDIGDMVKIGLKSTSVTVGVNVPQTISFSNEIDAVVENITRGKILCSILLHTHAGSVESIMTVGAFKRLNLKENDRVKVYIRASEVAIYEVLND
ncbi:MAG: transporter [Campylobacteraceae bacterium]|nr:transporter [Campylobacteraceae bacterium]